MFCKYHKIAASPTAKTALVDYPQTCKRVTKHMTARRPTKMEIQKHKLPDRTLNILGPHKNTYFSPCRVSWKRAASVILKGLRPEKRIAGTVGN